MAIRCRPLDAANAAAWDAFVDAAPFGTFFHRAAWAEVIARAFGHAPHYALAERDGAVVGVLPLVHVRSLLFGSSLMSSPFCVYGGPLAADAEAAAALHAHAATVMRRVGAKATEFRLLHPLPEGWLPEAEWPARSGLSAT